MQARLDTETRSIITTAVIVRALYREGLAPVGVQVAKD